MSDVLWEEWFDGDDLISLMRESLHECVKSTVRAVANRDLSHGIDLTTKLGRVARGDSLAKKRVPEAARVLIMSFANGFDEVVDEGVGRVLYGSALAKVGAAVLSRDFIELRPERDVVRELSGDYVSVQLSFVHLARFLN